MKAIILAAGEGRRMHSDLPKVLHEVCGRPMIKYVVDTVREAGATEVIVVVGYKSEEVCAALGDGAKYAWQREQLGTGHAVTCAREYIAPNEEILVTYGDMPLVTADCIAGLRARHIAEASGATAVSAVLDDPSGYGRVIYDEDGRLSRIVEHKDADEQTLAIREVNTGVYMYNSEMLSYALDNLKNNNAAGEYYLTDTLEIIKNAGYKIGVYKSGNPDEFLGSNTLEQLAGVARIMRRRINGAHMSAGVSMIDPENTYIDYGVTLGAGTKVYPGVIMEGASTAGAGCVIGPNTRVVNSRIGAGVEATYSVVLDSTVGDYSTVGPFAYIRPGSEVAAHCKIGDFVEIKNSTIGNNTKVSHLTYIGDSDVGEGVNFGCGTVTVNYDGVKKYRAVVHDNAFIGCNTNLIAPVTVEEGAYIAAGSTITDDVPGGALAIARARQVNLPDRADKHIKRKNKV